jgi:hypothetical protein
VKQLEEALLPQLKSLSQSRVRTRNFNSAQKLYERLLADLKQNDTPGAASKAFELCQTILQSASAVNPKDETVNDTANLEYEQIEYFLRRIRTRAKLQDPDVLTAFSAKGSSKLTLKQCMDAAIKASI